MRRRLDAELVRRGITATRSEGAAAVDRRRVTVSGRLAIKAGTLVAPDEPIVMLTPARFVSRGGEKLDHALDRFGVEVANRVALDAGASTGGFTDCLLSRGAGRVLAVDVGRGQLHDRLRRDPRVEVLERTNVRSLEPADLVATPDLVTADLSFISLRLVVPALARCAARRADFVLLVKPQFEAGARQVGRGGVVRDPEVRRQVAMDVAGACAGLGLTPRDAVASPLLGPAGNVEIFLWAGRDGTRSGPEEVPDAVAAAIGRAARGPSESEESEG